MFKGLKSSEEKILKRLDSPAKIQDYLNSLPFNFEPNGDVCRSPRLVMRTKTAHCIEGAMFAAAALAYHGEKPLLMDLSAARKDFDHVVALFRKNGKWGAISKTNHAVLRYREPIYRTLRELALSYFHEYFTDDGTKNLRSYSAPLNLNIFSKKKWVTDENDIWYVAEKLCDIRHFPIADKKSIRTFRPADDVEIRAGKVVEWKKNSRKKFPS